MKVYVDEEYGYREYLWEYPGNKEQLKKDFFAGRIPLWPMGIAPTEEEPEFDGYFRKMLRTEIRALHNKGDGKIFERVDAMIHIHEVEDSDLSFADERYPWPPETRYNGPDSAEMF